MRSIPLVIIALLAAGCSEQANPDVSYQFRETPLRQLQGVEFGMPARELKRSRPAAKYSPLVGLHELIPGYGVDYRFQSARNEAQTDVEPTERLVGVVMVQLFPSEEAAIAEWGKSVASVTSVRRIPDYCLSFPTGGREARWYSSQMTLAIGAFPPIVNMAAGGPRVIYTVSPIDMMKRPENGEPIPCPTS